MQSRLPPVGFSDTGPVKTVPRLRFEPMFRPWPLFETVGIPRPKISGRRLKNAFPTTDGPIVARRGGFEILQIRLTQPAANCHQVKLNVGHSVGRQRSQEIAAQLTPPRTTQSAPIPDFAHAVAALIPLLNDLRNADSQSLILAELLFDRRHAFDGKPLIEPGSEFGIRPDVRFTVHQLFWALWDEAGSETPAEKAFNGEFTRLRHSNASVRVFASYGSFA